VTKPAATTGAPVERDGPGGTPERRSRRATERALERAAVRLLERDGVLAGLNLREVADEAGVNRGLVYHYFGSRQDLLRSALRDGASRRFGEVRAAEDEPFRTRMAHFLSTMVRHRRAVRLATLLVCDGDRSLRTMPLREATRALLERDVADGELEATDLDAVHVAVVSLVYGYVLYRDHVAEEIGAEATDLDARMAAVLDRMLAGLAPTAGSAAGSTAGSG
jgi:AcrR family transcriptional regulator